MNTRQDLELELKSLFARFPELGGFAVDRDESGLFVSEVGISPRLSAEQYGEIFQDIARTLSALLEAQPEAGQWLRGRTFARSLH